MTPDDEESYITGHHTHGIVLACPLCGLDYEKCIHTFDDLVAEIQGLRRELRQAEANDLKLRQDLRIAEANIVVARSFIKQLEEAVLRQDDNEYETVVKPGFEIERVKKKP